MKHQTQGFILGYQNVNDADRIFSIFTYDFGRIEVMGKAIRKINSKLRAGMEALSFSEIEFFQGKRRTLTDAKAIKKYQSALYDLSRLEVALHISELLQKSLKEGQRDEQLFFLIQEVFEKLEGQALNEREKNVLVYYFIWNLLFIQGKQPEIQKCAICKEKLQQNNLYFSLGEGGSLCPQCAKHNTGAKKINTDIIKLLRLFFKKDWDILSRLTFPQSSHHILAELSKESLDNFINE